METKQKKINLHKKVLIGAFLLFTGCDKSVDSFSVLSESQNFQQSAVYVQRKVDVLWVIDNSGSMQTSQTSLASNFRSFINRFSQQGKDFHMAVTTTDAYLGRYSNNLSKSRFKDGLGSTHSGVFVIDQNTPNIESVFSTNITQGTAGSGDERAFSSIEEALKNKNNSDFRRTDAFLSIIIVSDEDDFSHNDFSSYYFTENYNDSKMFSISYFTSFLDNLTASTESQKNYNVNTISILDQTCLSSLNNTFTGRKIGSRYKSLVDATKGVQGSLCSDFGNTLEIISNSILELSSTFTLDRIPIINTLQIYIDGSLVPEDSTNGWTYDSVTNSVTFHGSFIPPQNSNVQILFDPAGVKI